MGKYLCDFSREEEHEAFLSWLKNTIIERNIDVLIIAGDVFDSANPPHSSTALLYRFLTSIHYESNCEVVIVGGNHDSAKLLDSVAPLLKTHRVHVVGGLPDDHSECVVQIGSKLIVAAIPFLRDRDVRISQPGEAAAEIQEN